MVKSYTSGPRTRLLPPTIADLHSPDLIEDTARCNAYIDDKQAVSNVILYLLDVDLSLEINSNIPRSMEIEDIVETVAKNSDSATRCHVRQWMISISDLGQLMVVIEVANEDAGI